MHDGEISTTIVTEGWRDADLMSDRTIESARCSGRRHGGSVGDDGAGGPLRRPIATRNARPGRISAILKRSALLVPIIFALSCERPTTAPSGRQIAASGNASVSFDRSILTDFFHATGGDAWNDNSGWLSAKPLHEWFGVRTQGGRVTSLDLPNNNLTGRLPARLADLENLVTLNLPNNQLSGAIPPSFGSAPRLRDLLLSSNEFSGPLPEALGDAPALKFVIVSYNSGLRGPLPSSFGQLSLDMFLAEETALCLPSNLYDWLNNIPRHSVLQPCETSPRDRAALVSLYHAMQGPRWEVRTNWLTDKPIYEWHGVTVDRHGRVVELTLNGNNLTGPLPESLWELTALTNLELYDNNILGYIPPGIGKLSRLINLELDQNRLTGSLPMELLTLRQLKNLELERNELTGRLPSGIRHLESLESFEIFLNELSGPLPPELGELTNLEHLALSLNNFSGSIPPELGNLTNLVTLFLNDNRLTGAVPSTLGNLAKLEEFFLRNNELTQVPDDLAKLTNLQVLQFSDNIITGPLPVTWTTMPSLQFLDLSRNRFSGPIPDEIGDFVDLRQLRLSGNEITGTLPAALGNLAKLGRLDVSYNRMHGELPPELAAIGGEVGQGAATHAARDLSAKPGPDPRGNGRPDGASVGQTPEARGAVLATLILNNNDFSGRLPPEWGRMYHLQFLDVSGNEDLHGVFPLSFTELVNLRSLYTGGTDLCLGHDGALQKWAAALWTPWGLRSCTRNEVDGLLLREMYEDMDGGGWSDARYWGSNLEIKSWRGVSVDEIGQVSGLTLPNMNITAELSPILGRLSGLRTLILTGNNIHGRIPANLSSLTLLRTFDVADNPELHGIVDQAFTDTPIRSFVYDGTAVCVPGDPEFDEWVAAMIEFEGDRCVRQEGLLSVAFTQAMQAIQTARNDVPLVQGRDVALRIYIAGDSSGYYGDVPIRVTVRQGSDVAFSKREIIRGFELLPGRTPDAPMEGIIDRLNEAANLTSIVPGEWIQPGVVIEIAIDEDRAATGGEYVLENLEIQETRDIAFTIVPVVSISYSDRSIIAWAEDNAELAGATLENLFGLRKVSTVVHDVYVTDARLESNRGPAQLLAELSLIRLLEGDDSYWYGVGRSTGGWFRGLADLGGYISVGKDVMQELAHEMGHVFGLKHAPCGSPTFLDEEFPYKDGSLGGWAYDLKTEEVVSPEWGRDIMGYCYGKGWISDYNFKKTMREFSARSTVASAERDPRNDEAVGVPGEALVVWGYVDGEGIRLEPPVVTTVRTAEAGGTKLARSGEYNVELYGEGGTLQFSGNFDMREDSWGGKQFVVGVRTAGRTIEKVVVRGPEGRAEVTMGDRRSVTIVRGLDDNSVRGVLRDWSGPALPEGLFNGGRRVSIETTVGLERDVERSGLVAGNARSRRD